MIYIEDVHGSQYDPPPLLRVGLSKVLAISFGILIVGFEEQ